MKFHSCGKRKKNGKKITKFLKLTQKFRCKNGRLQTIILKNLLIIIYLVPIFLYHTLRRFPVSYWILVIASSGKPELERVPPVKAVRYTGIENGLQDDLYGEREGFSPAGTPGKIYPAQLWFLPTQNTEFCITLNIHITRNNFPMFVLNIWINFL